MKWLYVFALYVAFAAASETPDGNYYNNFSDYLLI